LEVGPKWRIVLFEYFKQLAKCGEFVATGRSCFAFLNSGQLKVFGKYFD
jgi:hypothetical protein